VRCLEVAGEQRSVWLFDTALRNRIADEVAKRPGRDLTAGEPVLITRGGMATSANGRDYRSYRVRFPDEVERIERP